eukprot:3307233-Rhodomonas_salina.4
MAFLRRWRQMGVHIIIWIDDLCIIIMNLHNTPTLFPLGAVCRPAPGYPTKAPRPPGSPGPASYFTDIFIECCCLTTCIACHSSYLLSLDVRRKVVRELADLGWLTNEKDSGPPTQEGEFLGT